MEKKVRFTPDWWNIYKFLRESKADWKPKLVALVAVIYLIWPIDLIPDLAPVIGWLDDIGITTFAAGYLIYSVNKFYKNTAPDDVKVTIEPVAEAAATEIKKIENK